jgi:excisionase family DNA binding protein
MEKKLLTTGDIAKYCSVNFRTVVRWIERGILKSHKLPGRGDNRVQIQDFISFLKENNLPIPEDFKNFNQKILVVDDDEDIIRLVTKRLKKLGFEVKCANDGFTAGAMMQSFSPAVIVLDLKMPGLSGIEVIKSIRNFPGYTHQKILVLSGAPQPDIDSALEAGANDHLKKPFKVESLIEKITVLIES